MRLPHVRFHSRGTRRHEPGYLLSRQYFLHLYRDPETGEGEQHHTLQVVVPRRPKARAAAKLHVGSKHSETPIDAHVILLGAGAYFNTSIGGSLAQLLTRGKSKDLEVVWHGSRLWWKLWTRGDGNHVVGQYPYWREGSTVVNVLDRILGRRRYRYTDVDKVETTITLPEAVYPVTFKLQRCSYGRERGRRIESWNVDWSCYPGIPSAPDRDGWKDGRVQGSGFTIPTDEAWLYRALHGLAAWVNTERMRTGYTPELKPESETTV